MRKTSKRILGLLLASSLMLSMVACGTEKDTDTVDTTEATNTTETTEAGDTVKQIDPITAMLCYWDAEAPSGDDVIMNEIEKRLGAELDVTWVPAAEMPNVMATSITGGDLPEVFAVRNLEMRNEIFQSAIDQGLFWDLTEYIDEYDNLSTIPQFVRDGLDYDGSIYGIPRMVSYRGGGIILREDWLEKFGLGIPSTLDEFRTAFDKFTNEDPDANGQDDTIGLAGFGGAFVRPLMLAAGCPMDWWINEETNEVLPMYVHENFLPYLDFMKGLYDDGLMNRDFSAIKMPDGKSLVNQGKAGAVADTSGNIISSTTYSGLLTSNPDAKLVAAMGITQPDGTVVAEQSPGFSSMYCITKTAVQSEERLREILQFFNDSMDQEIVDLFTKGIEGVHYKYDKDMFSWIDQDLYTKDARGTGSFYVTAILSEGMTLGSVDHAIEYYDFQTDESIKSIPVINHFFVPNSDDSGVAGTVETACIKYVMGEVSRDDVAATIDAWIAGGGDKKIADFTAQYAKRLEAK